MSMKKVLEKIVQDKKTEGRWLNTLSLLEFIGSRKISKTVASLGHPSIDVLQHWADEARHAHSFKNLSQKISGKKNAGYLCEKEGVRYFQTMDHGVAEWLKKKIKNKDIYVNYLFTTCLIERRAMKIYPLYKKITKSELVGTEVDKIIHEEISHKGSIESQVRKILKQAKLADSFKSVLELEEKLFGQFVSSIETALN